MRSSILEVGKRLKDARDAMGLSLQEAAKRLEFPSYQTLAKIEKGEREVRASELAKFSKEYFIDVAHLLLPETGPVRDVPLLWRSAPQGTIRKEIETRIRHKFEEYHLLESFLEITDHHFIPATVSMRNINDDSAIDDLASSIAKYLDLGPKPAFLLQQALEEKCKVKVLYEELEFGSAATTIHPEYGAAIVVNSKEAPWRQRFTLCHEFFHVLTWDVFPLHGSDNGNEPSVAVERKADRFASALLLPEAEVRRELKSAQVTTDLVDIAMGFGVSTIALIYRLANLGIIKRANADALLKDDTFTRLDRRLRNATPEEKPISERFIELASKCLRKGHISRGKFSALVGIHRSEIDNFLTSRGLVEIEGALLEDMYCRC